MNLRNILLLALGILLAVGVFPGTSRASTILDLRFDENSWLLPPVRRAPNGDPRPLLARLDDSLGAAHSQIVIDTGSNYSTWLQSEVSPPKDPPACTCSATCPGACAVKRDVLAFKLSPSEVENPLHRKDKVQLQLAELENPQLALVPVGGSEAHRFVGFEFKLAPDYAVPFGPRGPGKFVIHFQLTQGNGHPVFTVQTDRNADDSEAIDLVFYVNNDEIENDFYCLNTRVSQLEIFRVPNIQRGEWHKLVMQFVPQFEESCNRKDGCGRIAAWLNGAAEPSMTFEGDWGYTPGEPTPACRPTSVPKQMSAGLGIYRNLRNGVHTIYFDNVKFGTTFDAVDG